MWAIVKNYPKALRTNTDLIGGIAQTIKRGLKSLDDMADYAESIGATYLKQDRIKHILRGDGLNGGRHHISAVVDDPSIHVTNITDRGNGFYKARMRKEYPNGILVEMDSKDFFPDDWDEFETIDAIKSAYDSYPNPILMTDEFIGVIKVNGQDVSIKIIIKNGNIHTAYPV